MKRRRVLRFECEYCGELFVSTTECELHELTEHKCPKCVHGYYVYGCEHECELLNAGKACNYEEKKDGQTS